MAKRPNPLPDVFTVRLNAAELGALTMMASQWARQTESYFTAWNANAVATHLVRKLFEAFPAPQPPEPANPPAARESGYSEPPESPPPSDGGPDVE